MRIGKALRSLFAKRHPDQSMSPVGAAGGGGWRRIIEPFAGAWQRGIEEKQETVLCYSAVYACLSRIATDIGKLPFQLKEQNANGLWEETTNPAYSPLLRKPNHYQTPAQFREAWILSKLIHGNAYVLKQRDNRGVVVKLFVLDPCSVVPMVTQSGDVYYQVTYSLNRLAGDNVNGQQVIIPASEIIHDREVALQHQLIGVPPLMAAHWPAVKNMKIMREATQFFANGANPGGILTAPAGMSDEDAKAVTEYWQTNFTGTNAGRVAVIGADMKFTSFAFKAIDSQMVEQLRYSDEQIAHAFGVPAWKVGIGQLPSGLSISAVNQQYFSDALQARIEAMEDCLDQGLGLGDRMGVELNLEPLLRMDAEKQATVEGLMVKDGIKAPNEARRRFGLKPLQGGDSVYLQQQNFSLEALARRDASNDPFGTGAKALPAPQNREMPQQYRKRQAEIERETKSHYRYDWQTDSFTYIGPWQAAA